VTLRKLIIAALGGTALVLGIPGPGYAEVCANAVNVGLRDATQRNDCDLSVDLPDAGLPTP
jgi:threonine/homoserine/homoserine lactone efflux protein